MNCFARCGGLHECLQEIERAMNEDFHDFHLEPLPADAAKLHYLLATPFRYPAPPPVGSRFRGMISIGVGSAPDRSTQPGQGLASPAVVWIEPQRRLELHRGLGTPVKLEQNEAEREMRLGITGQQFDRALAVRDRLRHLPKHGIGQAGL